MKTTLVLALLALATLNLKAFNLTLAFDYLGTGAEGFRLEIVKSIGATPASTNMVSVTGSATRTISLTNLANGIYNFRLFPTNTFGDGLPSNTLTFLAAPPTDKVTVSVLSFSQ